MSIQDAALLKNNLSENYDFAVVGSGAGGAVIAKELAEAGMKVAVLEEGGHHTSHCDLASDAIRRLYRDQGITATIGTPFIPVPLGKALGGTTVINSGTCFRLPNSVLSKWRNERGLSEIEPVEMLKAFELVEKEINAQPANFAAMSRPNTLMHELFEKEGLKGSPIKRNVRNCEGCGMCCYGCTSKAKQSMDVSYIPKALAAGATVYTHARVKKILVDSNSAKGVSAEAVMSNGKKTGVTLQITARKTIVSAGSFFTPLLLKASGIARKNKHVGQHLTIHPATKVFAEFNEKIEGWKGIPQAYYLDSFHHEGIMFEGIFIPPDLTGLTVPFGGKKLVEFIKRYAYMTSFGFLISDESEGRLLQLPLLGNRYYYSLTPGDVAKIKRGISFLARIFLKGGAIKVYPLIRGQNTELTSLADVDRFENSKIRPQDVDCMAFHPLGTCRMALSQTDGVCDQNHQVFGTPNLHLCDGSVIPTPLGVNPQMTIMAMATRLSFKLLEKC